MSTTDAARDLIGYGKDYPQISWPGDARIAVSFVVNFEEGSERTPLNGDTIADPTGEAFGVPAGQRNLINESLFEYGSRVGFWRLLDILGNHDIKATFFACGMALEMNPDAAREITANGHEPASHGYRWMPSNFKSREEERETMLRAIDAGERTTGERPLGWFSMTPSEHTRELLVEEGGFVYDCDSYADDLPYFVEVSDQKRLVIPYDLINNDGPYTRPPGYSEPGDYFHQLKAAFDYLYEEGASSPKMMSVGIHMRLSGRPGRANALEEFIRYVRSFPDVWIPRRIDIARWWLEHYSHLPTLPTTGPATYLTTVQGT